MELKGIQLLILCLAVCIFDGDAKAAKKIQRGENAHDGEFPYQVRLRLGGFGCGGSIISESWILTAAHCVYTPEDTLHNPEDIKVYAGITDLEEQLIPNSVSHVFVHPRYDTINYMKTTYFGDIALLKLAKPMKLDSHRRIILLPKASSDYPLPGTQAVVTGWGHLFYESVQSVTDMQKLNMSVMSLEECRRNNNRAITNANICARGNAKHSGTCQGDSGGPLVANGRVIGVVSGSFKCGEGKGDIFTNVAYFSPWISSVIDRFPKETTVKPEDLESRFQELFQQILHNLE